MCHPGAELRARELVHKSIPLGELPADAQRRAEDPARTARRRGRGREAASLGCREARARDLQHDRAEQRAERRTSLLRRSSRPAGASAKRSWPSSKSSGPRGRFARGIVPPLR